MVTEPAGPPTPRPMSYAPRTIAYLADVIYPPKELRADQVQSLHNALFARPELSYQNFQIAQDGIHLSNIPTQPGSVSLATFRPDRIVFREELRGITIEEFATRVVNVCSQAFQTLSIPMSLAQQFAVRSLINPTSVKDSRELMMERVVPGDAETWQTLGRPLQGVGLTMTFPQTATDNHVFNVRLETWHQDPRSLWVENIGSFTQPVPAERLPDLGQNLFTTYRFATGPVTEFIARFDRT